MPPELNSTAVLSCPFDKKRVLGSLAVRASISSQDIERVQSLRARVFATGAQRDVDAFDRSSVHLLVEDRDCGRLVACCRLSLLDSAQISSGYSGQFYNLSRLEAFPLTSIEIGRFCTSPGYRDPNALRILWGMIAAIVDCSGAGLLFGCSSFTGTDEKPYRAAFEILQSDYLAPEQWKPTQKLRDVVKFAPPALACKSDKGWAAVPPLLRTYLSMGGWVSDHAVVDRALNTLHVFTGVEVSAIPKTRQDQLRRLSAALFGHGSGVVLHPKTR